MVQHIPTPDPRTLLPPLLACLPAAFASPRPPPALLPLLTPILRHRFQFLAVSSAADSWLFLLNRERDLASKLPAKVEELNLEPHPVSGELEIEDPDKISYRRLDPETLHVRFELGEFGLLPTYLWCTSKDEAIGCGWLLAELRTLEDKHDGCKWYQSREEAEEGFKSTPLNGSNGTRTTMTASAPGEVEEDDDDDDDAYWAAYDRTPGRTPAKRSPAPLSQTNGTNVRIPSTSELEYFSRYMMEVQPAMDPYDPDEDPRRAESSELNNEVPKPALNVESFPQPQEDSRNSDQSDVPLYQPRPSSSSSSGSVKKLEEHVDQQAHAERAIKQHISTDIKSLYRLAKASGIERLEFERIVRTELEILPMMDEPL